MIRDEHWMEPMSGFKYDSLKPLLESQGIEVSFNYATSIDYDMSGWRECYSDHISLTDSQARYVNLVPRNGKLTINQPWIRVEDDPNGKDRVIFNRTPRYRNPEFNWKKVLKHFGKKALFVGRKEEHEDFCNEIGDVDYYPTENCLDVAKVISASDFFVGNQSSSFWIAAGLRKHLLQETFAPAPNSIVEYQGAWYCLDGKIDFDKLA